MDILQVLEGATYVAFIVGAIVAVVQLQNIKRDRWIALMLQIADHATTKEFENALSKVVRATANDAKGLEEQVSYQDLCMVADYLEYVAYLTTQGHIAKGPILGFFPFGGAWQKLSPWIVAQRGMYGSPRIYKDIEMLAGLQTKVE